MIESIKILVVSLRKDVYNFYEEHYKVFLNYIRESLNQIRYRIYKLKSSASLRCWYFPN